MSAPRRILYFSHNAEAPSGGVRVLYEHVRLLARNGFDAYIVHSKEGFRPAWFRDQVPTLYITRREQLRDSDLFIVPEDYQLEPTPQQRIIFCQGHFHAFIGMGQARSWREMGASGVFVVSKPAQSFVKKYLGFDHVPIVPNAIDHERFKPTGAKRLAVAVMPRKRMFEAEFIYQFVSRQMPDLEWAPIHQVSEEELTRIYRESAIFLSLSRFEGHGLPPLEAMASGCAVVGFHGGGGLDYATPENGMWAPDDDIIGAAERLMECVTLMRSGDERIKQMVERGRAAALTYTEQRQEAALLEVMREYLAQGAG